MSNESEANEMPQETLDKFEEFAKDPIGVNEFSFIGNSDFIEAIKQLNLKYAELFFIKYSDLKSIKEFNSIISDDLTIWKMFGKKELNDLINLLDKYQIKDETIKNDVINSLAIYLIYADFYSIQKNDRYLKVKKVLEFFNFYKKKQLKDKIAYRSFNSVIKLENLHIKDPKLSGIETTPPLIFNLINYLKFPAKKPNNPAINFFVAKITDAGINSGIKKNFADCAIPLIRELKKSYPDYFKEITSYGNDYFSNKAKLGRELYRENQS